MWLGMSLQEVCLCDAVCSWTRTHGSSLWFEWFLSPFQTSLKLHICRLLYAFTLPLHSNIYTCMFFFFCWCLCVGPALQPAADSISFGELLYDCLSCIYLNFLYMNIFSNSILWYIATNDLGGCGICLPCGRCIFICWYFFKKANVKIAHSPTLTTIWCLMWW